MTLIMMQTLNKVYHGGVYALNNVDLTIPPGMFGLLGPNGAGKTTLMRILAGIVRPTSGTIRIGAYYLSDRLSEARTQYFLWSCLTDAVRSDAVALARPIARHVAGRNKIEYDGGTERGRTAVKRMLGYLPQDFGVYPDLNAREFLDYIAILKGLRDRTLRHKRIEALLEIVSLTQVANRKLKTYSGGMKRRIGIAQALLNDPALLIVDEPTAGLDPEERIRFRNLLSELGGNRTVLLSTHIVEDIAQTCQRLAVLKDGRLIYQGTTAAAIREAQGKVWIITTSAYKPEGNFTVVATLNMGTTAQYRVVGDPSPEAAAVPAEPTLEDAYVWLMREQLTPGRASIS
jgi:ABC-2 type transport system ATP-binding protein